MVRGEAGCGALEGTWQVRTGEQIEDVGGTDLLVRENLTLVLVGEEQGAPRVLIDGGAGRDSYPTTRVGWNTCARVPSWLRQGRWDLGQEQAT